MARRFGGALLVGLCLTLGSAGALAQSDTSQKAATPNTGELYYQLQLLQQEMMTLRGLIEEQGNQIRKLKQQRLDDYLSLDRRLSALSQRLNGGSADTATDASGAADTPATGDATAGGTTPPSIRAADDRARASAEEDAAREAYQQAYGLIKQQQFDEARTAFQAYLKRWPEAELTPNAWYWLGELYLVQPDLEQARQAFEHLLDQYPKHRKIPDALFKLAKVYHLQNQPDKARALLEQVIRDYDESRVSAVKLAREYLEQNFSDDAASP